MARPILITNPRSDATFVALAEELLDGAGVQSPESLEELLRQRYPRAIVRERNLQAEAPTWYVYREGRWIPSDG